MASIIKREGRSKPWQVRYRDPEGNSRSRQFARQVDAKRFAATVETDKLRGSYLDPDAGRITLRTFALAWLEQQTFNVSSYDATEQRLRIHVFPTFGDVELAAIRPSMIQAWIAGRLQTNAPAHVRVMFVNLNAILAAAVDDQLIARNPCAAGSVKAPKVERTPIVPWSPATMMDIIDAHPERWRAIPAVAAGCGLRQGEVFGVRATDVDFLGRRLHVRQQVKNVKGRPVVAPPKGGKVRSVPLPEPVALALGEHLSRQQGGPDGLVFGNTRGGYVGRSAFNQYVWRPALERVGILGTRHTGMHLLRHSYASVLIDAGESIKVVSEYLGHSSAAFTLDVYGHLMPDSEDRTRKAIEAAFSRAPDVHQEAQ